MSILAPVTPIVATQTHIGNSVENQVLSGTAAIADTYIWDGASNDIVNTWELGESINLNVLSSEVAAIRLNGVDLQIETVAGVTLTVLDFGTFAANAGLIVTIDFALPLSQVESPNPFYPPVDFSLTEVVVNQFGTEVLGGAGADLLIGNSENTAANAVFHNGTSAVDIAPDGVENLFGSAGNDVYVWGAGRGNDVIKNWDAGDAGVDSVVFSGLASTDVDITRVDGDLFFTINNGPSAGEVLTAQSHFRSDHELAQFIFTDQVMTAADVLAEIDVIRGNGNVNGTIGDDVIEGGAGNDRLFGNKGNDVYRWGVDSGDDVIHNYDSNHLSVDIVEIVGFTADQLTGAFVGNDFVLTADSGETLTIVKQAHAPLAVQKIVFEDGTAWGQKINGSNDSDDVLSGGFGDDLLVGKNGNDTYLWGRSEGSDTIKNWEADNTGYDIVDISDLTAEDVSFSKVGSDLIITINGAQVGAGETLTIESFFGTNSVQEVKFNDEVISHEDIALAVNFVSGSGNVNGTAGNNTIYGTSGSNDRLYGGAGQDHYLWGHGQGDDVISNYSPDGSTDSVGTNFTVDELDLSYVGNDLVLQSNVTGDSLTILNQLNGGTQKIDYFVSGTIENPDVYTVYALNDSDSENPFFVEIFAAV